MKVTSLARWSGASRQAASATWAGPGAGSGRPAGPPAPRRPDGRDCAACSRYSAPRVAESHDDARRRARHPRPSDAARRPAARPGPTSCPCPPSLPLASSSSLGLRSVTTSGSAAGAAAVATTSSAIGGATVTRGCEADVVTRTPSGSWRFGDGCHVVDVERRDVDVDPLRNEGRAGTRPGRLRIRRASTPLCSLTPDGFADHVDRHLHRDLLVHPHRLEIDVDEGVAHRVVLELAHDGGPRLGVAGQADVHQHAAGAMAVEGALHSTGHHGERHRAASRRRRGSRGRDPSGGGVRPRLPDGLAGLD